MKAVQLMVEAPVLRPGPRGGSVSRSGRCVAVIKGAVVGMRRAASGVATGRPRLKTPPPSGDHVPGYLHRDPRLNER
jgi:hypothetical protein